MHSRHLRIARVVADWQERCERGIGESEDKLVRAHPELEPDLQQRLLTLGAVRECFRIPRAIGPYRVLSKIGEGGMATVYEATTVDGRDHLAIKVFRDDVSAEPVFIDRLHRVAKALRDVDHPGIVRILGVEQHEGRWCLVEEFVPGRSLRDVIEDGKRSPTGCSALADPRNVARMFAELAEAVEVAHSRIVHRDIKPGNLILAGDGRLKIMDFDLARVHGPDRPTRTRQVIGTAHYMSPEQARGQVDARSDVYSLGATLYEALTLQAPFEGDVGPHLWGDVIYMTPRHPNKVNSRIPVKLGGVVLTAMDKNPGRRYQSAGELARNLKAFLKGERVCIRGPLVADRIASAIRAHPRRIAAGALILSLVVVLGGVLWAMVERQRANVRAETIRQLLTWLAPVHESGIQASGQEIDDLRSMWFSQWNTTSHRALIAAKEIEYERLKTRAEIDALVRVELETFAEAVRRGAAADLRDTKLSVAARLAALLGIARAERRWPRADIIRESLGQFDVQKRFDSTALGQVTLLPSPSHARLYLFRWEDEARLCPGVIPRFVAVPYRANEEGGVAWLPCLRVTQGAAGVELGDFVVEVEGQPARGVFVSETGNPKILPGQRIERNGDVPVDHLHDWEYVPGRRQGDTRAPKEREIRIGGQVLSVQWLDAAPSALDVRAVPVDRLVADPVHGAGIRMTGLKENATVDVRGPLSCQVAAFPLRLSGSSRAESGVPIGLEEGSYLVVARCEGYDEARVNFVVKEGAAAGVAVDLLPEGSCPVGCCRIPAGPFLYGEGAGASDSNAHSLQIDSTIAEDYFIQRTEITMREFLEFVNETGLDKYLPTDNTVDRDKRLWKKVGDRYEPSGRSWEDPAACVSFEAAKAFVDWKNTKESRWVYSLPTEAEWEKAARGVDGRSFPWGDRFDPSLCVCLSWQPEFGSVPVGSEPRDESPYGVLDMGGSVWEFCSNGVLRGGHWGAHRGAQCSVTWRTIDAEPGRAQVYQGFRLVARLR